MTHQNRRNFLEFTIKKLMHELPQLEDGFVRGLEELLPMASNDYLERTYAHLKKLRELTREGLQGVDMNALMAELTLPQTS